MGQKVNPHGLRVGVIKDWDSKWYAEKDFADYLVEDHKIRKFLKNKLYSAGVSKIEIERASDRVKIIVYTAKPGVVIGKKGEDIEKIKSAQSELMTSAQKIGEALYAQQGAAGAADAAGAAAGDGTHPDGNGYRFLADCIWNWPAFREWAGLLPVDVA